MTSMQEISVEHLPALGSRESGLNSHAIGNAGYGLNKTDIMQILGIRVRNTRAYAFVRRNITL